MGHFLLEATVQYNKGQGYREGQIRILHILDIAHRTIHCINEKNDRVDLRIEDRLPYAIRTGEQDIAVTKLVLRKPGTSRLRITSSYSKLYVIKLIAQGLQEIGYDLLTKVYGGTPKSKILLENGQDVILYLTVEKILSPGVTFMGRLTEIGIYDYDTTILGIERKQKSGCTTIDRVANFDLFIREIFNISTAKATPLSFDRSYDSQKEAIKTIKNLIDDPLSSLQQTNPPRTCYDSIHRRGSRSGYVTLKKEFFFKEFLGAKDE